MFGDERYFDDIAKFWELQNTAIANARDIYLAKGWQDVYVLDVGAYFPSYEYVDTAKENGGKVYVRIVVNGEVAFYEGQLSGKEAQAKLKAANDDEVTATSISIPLRWLSHSSKISNREFDEKPSNSATIPFYMMLLNCFE